MTLQLEYVAVEIVDRSFLAIWTPEDGAVRAAGFLETAALWDRLRACDPHLAARGLADAATTRGVVPAALRAYAEGDLTALDTIAVSQRETPFRAEVRLALRGVPAGRALTYAELAARAGRPRAVRAAASGCATNLVALIVPCHRIVRADGGLGGYLFGAETKERLLQHEGARG